MKHLPIKSESVKEMLPHRNPKEFKQFQGLVRYYYKLIHILQT